MGGAVGVYVEQKRYDIIISGVHRGGAMELHYFLFASPLHSFIPKPPHVCLDLLGLYTNTIYHSAQYTMSFRNVSVLTVHRLSWSYKRGEARK